MLPSENPHLSLAFSGQYSTVQSHPVEYSTVQYSTVLPSKVQYSTVQSCPVQYITVEYILIRTVLTSDVLPHIKYRSALLNCTGQILPTKSSYVVFTNPEDKVMSTSI